MTDWIFQANPKRYDVHAAVARSSQDWWNTPRCRDRIALNDRVWLQIVGRDRPGIYYLATIASLPYESPEGEFGPGTPTSGGITASIRRWPGRNWPMTPLFSRFGHSAAFRARTCPFLRRLHHG